MQAHKSVETDMRAIIVDGAVYVPPMRSRTRLLEIVESMGFPADQFDLDAKYSEVTVSKRTVAIAHACERYAQPPGPFGYDEVASEWSFDPVDTCVSRVHTYEQMDFDDATESIIDYINRKCDAALTVVERGYTQKVISTWPQQRAEAEAYRADPNAKVPLITGLASRRGIELNDLASRIDAKVEAAGMATGDILGIQQKAEDAIKEISSHYGTDQFPADWFQQYELIASEAHQSFEYWNNL